MKSVVVKSDVEIKMDVLAELAFEPSVKMTEIGVLVNEGVVTLTGSTASYGERWNAVKATKRVAGVKALADEIEVNLPEAHHRTDSDLAAAASHHLDWSTLVPIGSVAVTVSKGILALEGEVEWWYQKDAAENAVQHLTGLKGLNNRIKILPKQTPSEVAKAIKLAFERTSLLDGEKIQVEINGNTVILRGHVRNHLELEEASRIAWAAAGVLSVENHITLSWAWAFVE